MNKLPLLSLFKFGEKCHIDEFAAGTLYLNTLDYFVKLEGDRVRRDTNEGTAYWMQPSVSKFSFQHEGSFREIKGIVGPIRYRDPRELDVNVLSLYALRSWDTGGLVEARTLEFGESVAVILQGDEFLRRVRRAAEAREHRIEWNLVEYCDAATYHGEMGLFRKPSEFEYQSEFRIAIRPGFGRPFELNVGSLNDICIVTPAHELSCRLAIGENSSLLFNTYGTGLGGSSESESIAGTPPTGENSNRPAGSDCPPREMAAPVPVEKATVEDIGARGGD